MELNSIPKSGTYADGVDRHNDNYSKINLELQTIRERGENSKGYFETLASLQSSFPSPLDGWQAFVSDSASSTGYYVAKVENGAWGVSAAEAPPIGVDLAGYARTGGSEKTVRDVEGEIALLAGDNILGWAGAEAFSISDTTFDTAGNVIGGVIIWPDGDVGSISNVEIGLYGVTSMRYNRSSGYALLSVFYNSNGDFKSQLLTFHE